MNKNHRYGKLIIANEEVKFFFTRYKTQKTWALQSVKKHFHDKK